MTALTLIVVLAKGGSVHCNAECGQAIGRLLYYLFRFIYAHWGWSGVLHTFGVAFVSYSVGRLGWLTYLASKPLPYFQGEIRVVDDHFEVWRYRDHVGEIPFSRRHNRASKRSG